MGRNYFCHFRGNILSSESTQNHLWSSEECGSPAPSLQNLTFPVWNGAWASRFKHSSDDSRVQAGLQTLHEGQGTKAQHLRRSWPPREPEEEHGEHGRGRKGGAQGPRP